MRLGLALPQLGPFADPALIAPVAAEAEALGFDSLWASERAHAPTRPKSQYPGGGDLPDLHRAGLDPLLVLTVAATATSTARLGTSTLSAPLRPPLLLARSLTGIDRLSGGRLNVGLGLSWLRDEYDAVGVPWAERGARLDETIDVLETLWGPDPVAYDGRFTEISAGNFQPKPVQPKPPVYLGGFSSAAFRRIAKRADGWAGGAMPVDTLRRALDSLEERTQAAGRAPVDAVIRINPKITPTPTGPTTGPLEHVAEYLHQLAELGVAEAFVDFQFTARQVSEVLDLAGRLRTLRPG